MERKQQLHLPLSVSPYFLAFTFPEKINLLCLLEFDDLHIPLTVWLLTANRSRIQNPILEFLQL